MTSQDLKYSINHFWCVCILKASVPIHSSEKVQLAQLSKFLKNSHTELERHEVEFLGELSL